MYKRMFQCSRIGSSLCTISKATTMRIIRGMAASLDRKPIRMRMEQKTSANTARTNENSDPKPIGSGNPKFPFIKFINLGMPCDNINTATAIRKACNNIFITAP